MECTIESAQEDDGRWLAELLELSGVMKYGETRETAIAQAEALALRVMADRIETREYLADFKMGGHRHALWPLTVQ